MPKQQTRNNGVKVVIVGVVLLVIGVLAGFAALWTIGAVVLIVGIALWLLGAMGHAVGGRSHYY
jgi:uncharacterized membrane protein HdeD (DUF308 family)